MNKCVLITSHLNLSEKCDAAHRLLDFLNDKGLPIIFAGNYFIPEEIQKKCDWVLYTKENPNVERFVILWKILSSIDIFDKNLKCNVIVRDHGYAHLMQIYRGFNLAKSLGFDYVIHLNYDIELVDDSWSKLISLIESNKNLVRPWSENCFATNFFYFSSDDYIKIMKENLDFYKNLNPPGLNENWICETFFHWVVRNSGITYDEIEEPLNMSTIDANNRNIKIEDFNFEIYHYEKENCFVLIFDENQNINSQKIIFHDRTNNKFYLEKTNVDNIFILPMNKTSDYLFEGKFIFNFDRIKDFYISE